MTRRRRESGRSATGHADEQLSVRMGSQERREQIMVQIAKRYYHLEHTQADIADTLGLTRWQVGRLLREAREAGIVRVEIIPRPTRRLALENALQQRYGLREALVLQSSAEDAATLSTAAQEAGRYLASLSPRPSLVGVSWGHTMSAMARWLPVGWNRGVHVVLLNGVANIREHGGPVHGVAERFAQAAKGLATLLPVPAIVGSSKTRQVLEEDPVIGEVMRLGREASVACVGIGSLSENSVLVQSGYIDSGLLQTLLDAGAVGDILGRFIDAEGHIISPDLDARTIGLAPQLLRDKAHAIGVGVGRAKHRAVKACLLARYINVLVTDEASAEFLLEKT
ncbi:sugar-binding transcriptional regulator [Verminephrobacter aporrectodeae]|uniref:sugar-binding transcriptional regulator n=1 Tax=Verminephrobacter aporrectodeae TaxID=1110389 RepID=UPI002242D5FB|nr:sugar-binding transcriptional regulator [Verminephrobacter aporrectodeae]